MSNPVKNIFSLPKGMLLFLAIYALSFPFFLGEHLIFKSTIFEQWTGLIPAAVWRGEAWRFVTYFLLAPGVLGWVVNLFWLVTLVLILARDWKSSTLWLFCFLCALGGALPIAIAFPRINVPMFSAGAVVFGLLAAWARLYGRERIIILGIGEMSVKQAALLIAAINAVIAFFACGRPSWPSAVFTFSLICGGLVGWAYLAIGSKRIMSRGSQTIKSERMARLEL